MSSATPSHLYFGRFEKFNPLQAAERSGWAAGVEPGRSSLLLAVRVPPVVTIFAP